MTPNESAALFETVLGEGRKGQRARRLPVHGVAWLVALGMHVGLWYAAGHTEPSLEVWSARMAALIHEELNAQAPIAIETPPVPELESKPKPPVRRVIAPKPAPPAAAAQVISVDARSKGPVDLTENTFIVGNSKTYVGGITSSQGTSIKPVLDKPSLARSVLLAANEWRCAWPASAVNEDIYEQFVVLSVVVAANGKVEQANLVSDPGYGFGGAAVNCALRTRFTPALDADGKPIRARSPSIRVRFTR